MLEHWSKKLNFCEHMHPTPAWQCTTCCKDAKTRGASPALESPFHMNEYNNNPKAESIFLHNRDNSP